MFSKQPHTLTVCQGQSLIIDSSPFSPATVHLAQFDYSEFNNALQRFDNLIQHLHNALNGKRSLSAIKPEEELKIVAQMKEQIQQNFGLFQQGVSSTLGHNVGDSRIYSLQQKLISSSKRFFQLEANYLKAQSHQPSPFILNSPAQISLPPQFTPQFKPAQKQHPPQDVKVPQFNPFTKEEIKESNSLSLGSFPKTPRAPKNDYILVEDSAQRSQEQGEIVEMRQIRLDNDDFFKEEELKERKEEKEEVVVRFQTPKQKPNYWLQNEKCNYEKKGDESDLRQRYYSELSVSTGLNSFEFLQQNMKEEVTFIDSQEMPSEPPSIESSFLEHPSHPFDVSLSPIHDVHPCKNTKLLERDYEMEREMRKKVQWEKMSHLRNTMEQIASMFSVLNLKGDKENYDSKQQPLLAHNPFMRNLKIQPQGQSFSAGADYERKREKIKQYRRQNKSVGFSCPQVSVFLKNNDSLGQVEQGKVKTSIWGNNKDYSKSAKVQIFTKDDSEIVRKNAKPEDGSPQGNNKRKAELVSKFLNIRSTSARRKGARRA